MSNLRLLHTVTSASGSHVAKVYRNTAWEEYIVKHTVKGVAQLEAHYHCDYKADATEHAAHWVNLANIADQAPVELSKDEQCPIIAAIFFMESYAHLKGEERTLLPTAEAARAKLAELVKGASK